MSEVSLEEFARVVLTFVAKRSGADMATLHSDSEYIANGLLDSLGTMDLFLLVEEHFGVKFRLEAFDVQQATTARRLYAQYVNAHHRLN
ncbi:MAG: acyl carrier protein [Hyphomicrobium sp.]|jgi:acyl carrier protein